MTMKTYHGSCQCKRVRFEADIDLSQGTGKCNCTSCWKRRWWSVKVKPEHFRSLGGETEWWPADVPVLLAALDGGEGKLTDSGLGVDYDRVLLRVVGTGGSL